MDQKNKIIIHVAIILLFNVAKNIYAESDSVLILKEKSSYRLPPELPEPLDIMYNNPFFGITQGIRLAVESKGNDLKGYALLADCYFDGNVKCLRTAGPDSMICQKMAMYLDTMQFRPWVESLVKLYAQEPVKLLISWSEDACYVEQLIKKKKAVDYKGKLYTREWKGFKLQQ